ncbi:MAG: Hsp70 family protein [Bdellovibrionaceae bacterium]|nr:Hsp70 family protein [Pseudobdellovibrionaceae bacterium]
MATNETILAIDFGTSHSLVGALHQGRRVDDLAIDPSSQDPTLMRTLLYFPNADQCFYGTEALRKYTELEMEGRLFRSFKSHLPNKHYLGTVFDNRILSLENMIGLFLLELKKRAEVILKTKVAKAVIGRPARYSMDAAADEFAIHRMKKAAEYAGFTDVIFIPEPLAAALEFRRGINQEKTILIGDFGGGTSDFTIMKITPDNFQKKDVLAVEGCPLAGDALDSVFMSSRLNRGFGAQTKYRLPMSDNIMTMPVSIMDRLNKPSQIVHLKERETYEFIKLVRKCSLRKEDKEAIDRLFVMLEDQQIFAFFEEIEKTKKSLSSRATSAFKFDYPDLETSEVFSSVEFEDWAFKVKNEIFSALDRCLAQAGLVESQIEHVFLTGGTAHVPFIQREFTRRFGASKMQTKKFFHSILSGLIESAKSWDELK